MTPVLEAEALVLDRVDAGEHHVRLTLLTPAPGLVVAMFRPARGGKSGARAKGQTAGSARPDVFDHAAVLLHSPKAGAAHGSVYFIQEYKVLQRHAGLARSYEALEAAAGLAKLIMRNSVHFESCQEVFKLCRQALGALEAGAPPEVVRFKALFLLARAEGYPAREQWLPTLAAEDRELAQSLLRRPVAETVDLPAESLARVSRLRVGCERWLAEHTDLELGRK